MRTIAVVAAALGICTTMASGQDRPRDEDAERFQLFASCSPVFPMVVLEQHSSYADDLEQAVLSSLSTALNGFVDEYRRVNERACPSDTDRADARPRPNGVDR